MANKRPYMDRDFTQTANEVIKDKTLKTSDKMVFVAISSCVNNETGITYLNQTEIGEIASIKSTNTVKKCVDVLVSKGYLKTEKKKIDGMRESYIYTITTNNSINAHPQKLSTTPSKIEDVQPQQLSFNNTQENNTKNNKNNISKEIGISYPSHESKNNDSNNKKDGENMLFDISHLEKRNSKKKLSKKELAYNRIENARNGHLRWDNVTKENMAYYYQEEHNKKYSYKVKVGYNRKYGTSDASVIEDIFHKQYNIPWGELPKAIDIALDVYTDVEHSPNYNNRLTPYMMYNNNTMMEKLMRQVKKELDNPDSLYGKSQNEIDAIKQRKKESRNKHMEKVRYMQGINKKIKAGTATQEEINYYNENAY